MGAYDRVLGGVRGGYRWVRRLEFAVLAAGLALTACLLVFLRVAHEVGERGGEASSFDRWALDAFRDPADRSLPVGPEWLRGFGRDVTALGSSSVLALVVAAVAGGLLLAKRHRHAAFVLGATGSGVLVSLALKLLFARERPDATIHGVRVWSKSFPSGHSMNAAIVYLTLGMLLARTAKTRPLHVYVFAASVGLTLLVGLTRVYLGVHYPTDVIAGWCAGFAWALAWWLVVEWIARKKPEAAIEAETPRG